MRFYFKECCDQGSSKTLLQFQFELCKTDSQKELFLTELRTFFEKKLGRLVGGHFFLGTVWHEPSCLRPTSSCFKLNITIGDQ